MEFIPSAGASFTSIFQGLLGILVLMLVAYGASSNRQAIP